MPAGPGVSSQRGPIRGDPRFPAPGKGSGRKVQCAHMRAGTVAALCSRNRSCMEGQEQRSQGWPDLPAEGDVGSPKQGGA